MDSWAPKTGTLIGAFALTGVLALCVSTLLAFFTVAASHTLDIPEASYRWLPRFFWASLVVPAVWVLAAGAAFFEMKRKMINVNYFSYLATTKIPGLAFLP